ncbi:MAG: homoserine O-succinyltransferase [Oligoflexia bacterium]|nr:homoserine O-succinyltransferase [Oligoflexia bacterium]
MTVILPDNYHAKKALEDKNISCITRNAALHQDIRALRIGILNIMPKAEDYEFSLLFPLGRSVLQIEPIWIRLKTHQYKSTNTKHLDSLYVYFEDAIKEKHLDGLIVTGAPVEEIPFEQVTYWEEITEIITYARKNIASTLGICWGGLALAKFMGIDKMNYDKKLFGVFETHNMVNNHPITGDMDDVFWVPQSRHTGIADNVLIEEEKKGNIKLLAHSPAAGYVIFESSDQKFLIHLGHPEYDAQRLVFEYRRDMEKGKKNVTAPENLNINNPLNKWRGHCLEFFSQWIKFVYKATPY